MVQFSSIFTGFTKSIANRNGKKSKHDHVGRETAVALAKEAKKNEMMLTSSGCVAGASHNLAVVFSKGGKKGINQDRFVVWEVNTKIKSHLSMPLIMYLKLLICKKFDF